ncbi:MAG: phosphatidate cytidylyltransferase [Planctomycetota bacterium]|jgi:phosphatidate cytidylyltransferase
MTTATQALSSATPASLTRSQRIWRRTQVGGGLATVVGLALWSTWLPQGPAIVAVLGFVMSVGCALEAGRMGLLGRSSMAYALIAAALVPYAVLYGVYSPEATLRVPDWGGGGRYIGALLLAAVGTTIVLIVGALPTVVGKRHHTDPSAARLLLWSLWVALPMSGLVPILLFAGPAGLVALILLSKLGDVVGYYVGSAIGRTHPFPNISPGKTTAGCVGSLLAGTLAGYFCQRMGLFPEARMGWASGLLAGAFVNIASQAGDLLESVAKRRSGVKDSGTTFGPSGGFLDLVDSLLLSIPVALLTWPLLFHLPYLAEGLRALGGN